MNIKTFFMQKTRRDKASMYATESVIEMFVRSTLLARDVEANAGKIWKEMNQQPDHNQDCHIRGEK